MDSFPRSTNFISLHGRLAEQSDLGAEIPGAEVYLEEHPALPEELKPILAQAGLEDTAEGKTSWETHISLPCRGTDSLELITARFSRDEAIRDGKRLEGLLAKGTLPGEVEVKVISYPGEDLIVPAMLWADIEAGAVGGVSVSAAADTLQKALTLMRQVLPGAQLNS